MVDEVVAVSLGPQQAQVREEEGERVGGRGKEGARGRETEEEEEGGGGGRDKTRQHRPRRISAGSRTNGRSILRREHVVYTCSND